MPAKLTPSQRLKVIERALKGENISFLCKEFNISRTLLYRWIKRYKEDSRKTKILALKPKSREVSPNGAVPEDKVRLILDLVGKHPSFSVAKIAQNLPKNEEGKPIVGHHGVQNVLKRLNLNTLEKRQNYQKQPPPLAGQAQILQYPPHVYTKGIPEYPTIGFIPVKAETLGLPHKEIRPQDRLAMIERVKLGEPVSRVCQLYGVSRTIFYRWLKRYEEAPEGQKLEALWDKKPKVSKYFNQAPEKYEEAVLAAVREHPELSSHKLVWVLPRVGERPILGNHGVQNVLRRHNLATYEQRLVYAQAYQRVTAFTRFFGIFENILSFIGSQSPALRGFIVKAGLTIVLTFFAGIVLFGAGSLFGFFGGEGFVFSIGMVFSLISLTIGMFFFLYSLKYYLTIAIVLSFSRQAGGGYEKEEGRGSFFDRLFGNITNGKDKDVEASKKYAGGGPARNATHSVAGGGLQPDISGILLSRKPFVSIHLATYNEKKVIDRLLTAATSMDYENYEIVVVDDSTDETRELLKKWEAHPRVKIIHRDTREGFKGGALREAIKSCDPRTEFVVVFDADFIPYPDTITQFLKYFQSVAGTLDFRVNEGKLGKMRVYQGENTLNNPSLTLINPDNPSPIAAIQGYQWHVLNKSENWITRGVRSEYAGSYVIERSGTEIYSGLKQIAGSVYMVRADVLKEIGWGSSITEDFQLTLKLYEKGYKVVYTPYIQAPAEAVSTIKRLIRQRMRWAEGHSHNVRKMFVRLLFGKWEVRGGKLDTEVGSEKSNIPLQSEANPASHLPASPQGGQPHTSRVWKQSPLTLSEKLELLYLSPYYLQAFLFMLGTFSWFLAEAVFRVKLPFWTEVWGWSLVLTNMLALPLVNMVGLFLEESEEKDYLGLFSFVALSYITAPFQGYAALKGFLEKEEGPWFRTPKTGRITDIFTPGKFYRFIFGVLGRPSPAVIHANAPQMEILRMNSNIGINSPVLALNTANNRFDSFKIRPRHIRWVGNLFFTFLIFLNSLLVVFAPLIPLVQPTQAQSPGKLVTTEEAIKDGVGPKQIQSEEITTPKAIHFTTASGETLEMIFHQEPRVRIKLGQKEMEITTTKIEGLGTISPKKSLLIGDREVRYEEIIEGVDLIYSLSSRGFEEKFILKKPVDFRKVIQKVNLREVRVIGPNSEVFGFYDQNNKEVFSFGEPWMREEGATEKERTLKMTLEKEATGYKLTKALTSQGQTWLADPGRKFPVVIDPTTIVSSGVTEAIASYGANQRKIVYSTTSSAWYVVYESPGASADLGDIVYYKSLNGTSWIGPTDIDSTDCTGQESAPSTWLEGALIYVVWNTRNCGGSTGTDDALVYITIDTTVDGSPDSLGSRCSTDDLQAIAGTDQNSIAVVGTNVFMVNDNDPDFMRTTTSCGTPAAVATGHGVTAADRPVLVEYSGTLHVFFQDGQLSWSRCADGVCDASGDWTPANQTIDATTSTVFSVTTNDTNIWILAISSSTGNALLYTCGGSCDNLSADWSSLTTPFTGITNLTALSITYDTVNADLYAHAIYQTNEIAYFRKADNPLSPSWDGPFDYGWSGSSDYLGHISSPMTVTASTQVGVVLRDTATYAFATVPENILILLLLAPFLPKTLKVLKRRKY